MLKKKDHKAAIRERRKTLAAITIATHETDLQKQKLDDSEIAEVMNGITNAQNPV